MPTKEQIDIEINAKSGKAVDNISKVGKELKKTSSTSKGTGLSLGKLKGSVVAVGVAAAAAAALIVNKLVSAMADATSSAIEFAEQNSALQTTFKDLGDAASDTVSELGKNYNIGKQEGTKFLGTLGQITRGLGFQQDEALALSKQLIQMGADHASFTGKQNPEVINAFTKALTGETDGLKEHGIVLNQADINQQLLLDGTDKLVGAEAKMAKARAVQTIILQKMGAANGDVARTMDSNANKLKTIKRIWDDFKLAVGEVILKAIDPIITKLRDFLQETEKSGNVLNGFKLVLNTVFMLMKEFYENALSPVIDSIKNVTKEFNLFNDSGEILKGIVTSIRLAFVLIGKVLSKVIEGFGKLVDAYVKFTPQGRIVKGIIEAVKDAFIDITDSLSLVIDGFLDWKDVGRLAFIAIQKSILKFYNYITKFALGGLAKLLRGAGSVASVLNESLANSINSAADSLDTATEGTEAYIAELEAEEKQLLATARANKEAAAARKEANESTKSTGSTGTTGTTETETETECPTTPEEEASRHGTRMAYAQEAIKTLGMINSLGREAIEIANQEDQIKIDANNKRRAEFAEELRTLRRKQKAGKDLTNDEKKRLKELNKLDAKLSKENENLKKKQAARNKGIAISSAIINTASAIMQVWAGGTLGNPIADAIFKGIQSALVLGIGVAQVAKISKTPAYAKGGIMPAGQSAVVGDSTDGKPNPELIIPRSESLAIPHTVLQKMVGDTNKSNTVNNIDNRKKIDESTTNNNYNVEIYPTSEDAIDIDSFNTAVQRQKDYSIGS